MPSPPTSRCGWRRVYFCFDGQVRIHLEEAAAAVYRAPVWRPLPFDSLPMATHDSVLFGCAVLGVLLAWLGRTPCPGGPPSILSWRSTSWFHNIIPIMYPNSSTPGRRGRWQGSTVSLVFWSQCDPCVQGWEEDFAKQRPASASIQRLLKSYQSPLQ